MHETALREIAEELQFVDDPAAIAEVAVKGVARHSEAPAVAVYRANDGCAQLLVSSSNGFPAAVPGTDRALLGLHAKRRDTEAPADSDLSGSFLLPFYCAGELGGFMVCRPRASGEVFDPDERDALRAVGMALGPAFERARLRGTEIEMRALRAELELAKHEIQMLRGLRI